MNITSLQQFDDFCGDFTACETVVIDTETNGLHRYQGDRPISLSAYFPEFDRSYNLAWAHGQGEISVPDDIRSDNFHKRSWQGRTKAQYYKRFWWNEFMNEAYDDFFGNAPYAYMECFRDIWNRLIADKLVVYYNAPFDIHMMEMIGFNTPSLIEDVLGIVKLVFEDFNYPLLIHPKDQSKIYRGNNELKWQAKFWKIPGAADGEKALNKAADDLSRTLAEFILQNWSHPINESFHNLKRQPDIATIAKRLKVNAKSEMWMLPAHRVAPYAEGDVKITWGLRQKLWKALENWQQIDLYREYMDAQLNLFIRMERNGALLDKDEAREQRHQLKDEMREIEHHLRDSLHPVWDGIPNGTELEIWNKSRREWKPVTISRERFKVGSPQQLQGLLRHLGLDVMTSDKKALQKLSEDYEKGSFIGDLVRNILHYRKAKRAADTYLKRWIEFADPAGYIHPGFNLFGAKTGRSSSSGDMGNVQNIPSRQFLIKRAIVTPPGWRMFQIDFGQIELRLAAWIAGCQTMIDMFNQGVDLHKYTMERMEVQRLLFGDMTDEEIVEAAELSVGDDTTPAQAVYKYCRTLAKTCNFALLYRGTYRVLVRMLDIPIEHAKLLHSTWNALYPEFAAANAFYEKQGLAYRPRPDGRRTNKYVQQPIGGRTRKFDMYPTWERFEINDRESFTQNTQQRMARDAFNAIVQGQAAYIMMKAGLAVCREYDDDVFRPFAVIHDSLNFYLREDMLHVIPHMQELMVAGWETDPVQVVDVEISSTGTWQDLMDFGDWIDQESLRFVTEAFNIGAAA